MKEELFHKYIVKFYSQSPYFLRILNAEMSDRGYYRCCMEYSTSNGEETMRSEKAHLMVEKGMHKLYRTEKKINERRVIP
jgi:hypothetical protein